MTLQDAYRAHYTALLELEGCMRANMETPSSALTIAAAGAALNNCIACSGMVYALQDGVVAIGVDVQGVEFEDENLPSPSASDYILCDVSNEQQKGES